MRVVLDSNVVLPGVFFGGVPGGILAAWSRGQFDVVVSAAVLAEYRRAGEALASGRPRLVEVWRPVMAWIPRHATTTDGARDHHDSRSTEAGAKHETTWGNAVAASADLGWRHQRVPT